MYDVLWLLSSVFARFLDVHISHCTAVTFRIMIVVLVYVCFI